MKSLAAHHPLIDQLNHLSVYDCLEAEPLIYQCFEQGIFEWSNPKFLNFLNIVVSDLLIQPRHERKQLRGLMYARYIAEHMPPGVDDQIRNRMVAIAAGEPEPKLKKHIAILPGQSNKVWTGPACQWPSPRIWPMPGFWLYQERIVNGRLSMEMRRRQAKLRRQQKAS